MFCNWAIILYLGFDFCIPIINYLPIGKSANAAFAECQINKTFMPAQYTKDAVSEALALVFLGKFADAELALSAMRTKEPDNPDICEALAILRIYAADYENALPLLDEAMRKMPDSARACILVALSLVKLHRLDEAAELYKIACELAPDDERLIRVEGAILIEQGNYDEALDCLSRYALEHPDDPWDVWNDLGSVYYAMQQFERAIEMAKRMGLSIPFVHFNRALCANALGNYENAKEYLSIALEADCELAPAWAALGLLIAADGEYERAADFIAKAIELEPEEPSHWYAMAQVMELSGDNEAASHYLTEGYKAAKRLQPDGEIPDGMK